MVAMRESTSDAYIHGEKLTIFIQECLGQAAISIDKLCAVSISSGPGSYTGLRIGVSTAKGLCYALQIPLIAVNSLESLKNLISENPRNLNLCPMIDARRMEVFSAVYSPEGQTRKEISADVIDENSYENFRPLMYFGDGAEKLKEIWANETADFIDCHASASGQIKIAYERFINKEFVDVAYFEPFYLKDFQTK